MDDLGFKSPLLGLSKGAPLGFSKTALRKRAPPHPPCPSSSPSGFGPCASSASLTAFSSSLFSPLTSGNDRFISSSASMTTDETASLANHLLFAGITYHGACDVLVFWNTSS